MRPRTLTHTRLRLPLIIFSAAALLATPALSHTPHETSSPVTGQHPTNTPISEPALDLSAEELAALPSYSIEPSEAFTVPGTPTTGSYPATENDPEHVTIYLDFTGETITNTRWNLDHDAETLNLAAAQLAHPDSNPNAAAFIHEVWASVAEDYAPFDVNVTTTAPHPDDLTKDSPEDRRFGAHVVITDSYTDLWPTLDSGGLAYVASAGDPFFSPALVFTTGMGAGDPLAAPTKTIAEGASHEAGHALGLTHHGVADQEYFFPSNGIWAPVMGAGYFVPLTQWSAGEYAHSTNPHQHDIEVLTDHSAETGYPRSVTTADGAPYHGALCPEGPIEYGGNYTAADPVAGCTVAGEALTVQWAFTGRLSPRADADTPGSGPTGTQLSLSSHPVMQHSVIRSPADTHHYHFSTSGADFVADLDVVTTNPNLNAALTLTNGQGAVVAQSNPEVTQVADPFDPDTTVLAGLGAGLSLHLDPGAYTLTVSGAGQGDPLSPEFAFWHPEAFTATGSTGNYQLTLQLDENSPAPAPEPAPEPEPEPEPASDGGSTSSPPTETTTEAAGTLAHTASPDRSEIWLPLAIALVLAGYSLLAVTRQHARRSFVRSAFRA